MGSTQRNERTVDVPFERAADSAAFGSEVGSIGWSGMPECQNCGGFVTEQYVRVFAPSGMEADAVRVCPQCPDKLRDGAEIREANSSRR